MNSGKMVFRQVMDFASCDVFKHCVEKYQGDYKVKDFSCWRQFLCMSFGQLTHRESLSDTALCLKLHKNKLYHLGIGQAFDKSTISRANESRDWRIYRDFALKLIAEAKALYRGTNLTKVDLKGGIYAIDSTVIDLCLSVFYWATYKSTKSAVKMHTVLDLKKAIPECIYITEGSVHDVNMLDYVDLPKGSYLVADKAYVDFTRLMALTKSRINFVIRAKENMKYSVLAIAKVDPQKGILHDQIICLTGTETAKKYQGKLRLVKYYDEETDKTFEYMTNNLKISAVNVAALYKTRWGIETFFKWIKQHLKILSFWGTSENAVKTQIWIGIAAYALVMIAIKKLKIPYSPYETLQMISLAPFDKTPLKQLFEVTDYQDFNERYCNQLKLF